MPGDVQPEIIMAENAGLLTKGDTIVIDGESYYRYFPTDYEYLRTCEFYLASNAETVDPGYENVIFASSIDPFSHDDWDEMESSLKLHIIDKNTGKIYSNFHVSTI